MAYKLTYFDVKAIGEPIRFILSYMGQEFEDIRIASKDEWPKIKNNFPFGRVPTLQIGEKVYTDSVAICRYLATKAGLDGANPEENYAIDQIVGAIGDLQGEGRNVMKSESEEAKNLLIKETLPFYMDIFDKTIKENGGYLANGKLSWVDLYLIAWSETLAAAAKVDFSEKYPHFKTLKLKVHSLPGIKEWIQRRPVTPM